jgi:hypothetical protein
VVARPVLPKSCLILYLAHPALLSTSLNYPTYVEGRAEGQLLVISVFQHPILGDLDREANMK